MREFGMPRPWRLFRGSDLSEIGCSWVRQPGFFLSNLDDFRAGSLTAALTHRNPRPSARCCPQAHRTVPTLHRFCASKTLPPWATQAPCDDELDSHSLRLRPVCSHRLA